MELDEDRTTTDNSMKAARYVVPARRQIISHADEVGKLEQGGGSTSVLIGTISVQIVPKQEVKSTFRTPCKFLPKLQA